MVIIKCKMCGGDIEVTENQAYGTCDSCGSKTTLPSISDERKANLFNRANHFRRLNDFDRALSAYESILNEDNNDAEAHWGVVLSRYGIEYIEDPITHEKLPTCHRMQYESILSDIDYTLALENAPDNYSKSLYEEEARRINEIQKDILTISKLEEPYDVFICYKERTDGGTRTKDSVLAQEIYYQLTKEGLKVFFSKISLEDKLGVQYEPYIFAALNSAKVMIVIGTKAEYFNATWVQNEWSRFLVLAQKDNSKVLIPCYRDIDIYDLPDKLSCFQSQDMSKIGFAQDLIHGVKKVIAGSEQKSLTGEVQKGQFKNELEPLLFRAQLFLEEGNFESANEYYERVLDQDPTCSKAYIGKLMIEFKVTSDSDFAKCTEEIDKSNNFKKALRFADDETKFKLNEYKNQNTALLRKIEEEIEYTDILIKKEEIYKKALKLKASANATYSDLKDAHDLLITLDGYKDSKELADYCLEKYLNNCYQKGLYNKDISVRAKHFEDAIECFKNCGDFKDAERQIEECKKLAEDAAKLEEFRAEGVMKRENLMRERSELRKKQKLLSILQIKERRELERKVDEITEEIKKVNRDYKLEIGFSEIWEA